jgi:transcriptional regulator with XRE-family HTH domain
LPLSKCFPDDVCVSTEAGRAAAVQAMIARRGHRGMTQEDLASAAGVSVRTIWNTETGGRWPIARTRALIEEALGWPSGHMEAMARQHDAESPVIAPDLQRSLERLNPAQKDYVIGLLTRRGDGSGQRG